MAKQLVRRSGNNGSASSKIVNVNKAQGNGNIASMQGTSRTIYDAVPLATTTVNSTYRLFEAAKTRNFPLTNLAENKLQKGESMAMEMSSLYIIECTSGTTNAVAVLPLAYFTQLARIYAGQLSFSIAQNQVIKKLPVSNYYAPFNPDSKFFGYYQVQVLAADPVTAFPFPQDVYRFNNDIIIPEGVEFYCDITVPPITLPAGFDFYLCMRISGLGSLYAPKSNF